MPLSGTLPYALSRPFSGNDNSQLLTSQAVTEIKSLMSQRGWRLEEAIAYVLRGAPPPESGILARPGVVSVAPGPGYGGGLDSIGPDVRLVP